MEGEIMVSGNSDSAVVLKRRQTSYVVFIPPERLKEAKELARQFFQGKCHHDFDVRGRSMAYADVRLSIPMGHDLSVPLEFLRILAQELGVEFIDNEQ